MTGSLNLTSFSKKLASIRNPAKGPLGALPTAVAASALLLFSLVVLMPVSSTADAKLAEADAPSRSESTLSAGISPASQSNSDSNAQLNARLNSQAPTLVAKSKVLSPKKRFLLLWSLGLNGESFQNQTEHSQIIGLGLNGNMQIVLLPGLMLRVKAGVALQNGYAQSDFGDTVPHNGLGLSEAVMQYHPWLPLYFQLGAIDSSYVGSAYLPAGAYPGALQKIAIGSNKLGVDLIAQETIPTSTTLATQTVDKEKTPYYTTQGIFLKVQPYDGWQLKATALHYKFENLPSLTAFDSLSYGNTILNQGPNTSAYAYQFDGYMGGADSKLTLVRGVEWTLSSNVLQNSNAPQSYRMAQWIDTGFDFALPRDVNFIPKFATYFAESDVAPGFYNSSDVGHNNRKGWSASSDFVFKKSKFKLGATYSDANVINATSFQSRQQYIQLRFESLYDLI